MATHIPGDQPTNMVERIKRLLTAPAQEWPRIDAEPMTIKGIYTGWVVPLAAIGPVAGLIGALVFGYSLLGVTYRPSIGVAVSSALVGYVLALISVYILSLIINALAPSFGGTKNPVSAFKVAAFTGTAGWLAGVFQIIPVLSWLALLGLYGLYLLWVGLPILMKVPEGRATPYVVVTMLVSIVVFLVCGAVATQVGSSFSRPMFNAATDAGTVNGSLNLPGMGTVDLDKANAAVASMKAATDKMQNGTATPIAAAALQAMLPATIGGFARGDVESQSGGVGGIAGSHAQGHYTSGDQSFDLSVTDMAAAGALASLGGAMNMQSSKQTATGYEKTAMVGGAMVTEKWDNQLKSGSYVTMVASRFMVSAEGAAPTVDTLKQAVASVDTGKLAALAR
ncbi:YIP1 family protein [Sphingomonas sp. QA11]|uniref:Yip1 family protein n=1 Tax=Sphingomonas sp. QA11 TaxID=2950605 RepID=UPI00234B060D|nr:Yip1 family protein [Sphingomonas sp. QA11]WCM25472.1 YIP1 family protein [Sphingomonas sp. QA11]